MHFGDINGAGELDLIWISYLDTYAWDTTSEMVMRSPGRWVPTVPKLPQFVIIVDSNVKLMDLTDLLTF